MLIEKAKADAEEAARKRQLRLQKRAERMEKHGKDKQKKRDKK